MVQRDNRNGENKARFKNDVIADFLSIQGSFLFWGVSCRFCDWVQDLRLPCRRTSRPSSESAVIMPGYGAKNSRRTIR